MRTLYLRNSLDKFCSTVCAKNVNLLLGYSIKGIIMKRLLLLAQLSLLSASAFANPIYSYTGSSSSTHSCEGVDADYIIDNTDVIGSGFRVANYRYACEQSSYVNGGDTEAFSKTFTNRASTSIDDSGANSTVISNAILDSTSLSLPKISMYADSELGSMGIARTFSVQQYRWTGAATELFFSAQIDYHLNSDERDSLGYRTVGSYYEAAIAASTSLNLSEQSNNIFPSNFDEGTLIAGIFTSSDDDELKGVARTEEKQISISFTVENNQLFYLFGRAEAWAWNGGKVDSLNTLSTNLRVANVDSATSSELIDSFVTPLSSEINELNSPTTFAVFTLGLCGLGFRRFYRVKQ